MVDIDSEFERHIPCDKCGSSDGNALYTDGHTYCFVCHNRTPATGKTQFTQPMTNDVLLTGYAQRLAKRKLSQKQSENNVGLRHSVKYLNTNVM